MAISPTAEPDNQLPVSNTQLPVPNTQQVVPNTEHFVPNTQTSKPNTQSPMPELLTVWSNSPNLLRVSESTWGARNRSDIYLAHSEHNPPCSAQHMRGSRSVGPPPHLTPPEPQVQPSWLRAPRSAASACPLEGCCSATEAAHIDWSCSRLLSATS